MAMVRIVDGPRFDSALPADFTDICWDPTKKCFMLINDEAMAEFFMEGDRIQKQSFISSTGRYVLRGWTMVEGKSCVIDQKTMTIQLSISRRKVKTYPVDAGANPSALAWDGRGLWSADAGTNAIYKHGSEADQFKVQASFPAGGKSVCGLAWDGESIWSCDRDKLFRYDGDMHVKTCYALPCHVTGITWRGTELWASIEGRNAICKIRMPD